MNLIPDLKHLTDRETFEAMVENIGGPPLSATLRHRRDASKVLDSMLTAEMRAAFLTYSDACSDANSQREVAAVRVGIAIGVGVGAALAGFPEEQPDAISMLAADVVAAVIGAPVPATVAHDCAKHVLRTLRRAALAGVGACEEDAEE